jgi:hypothetical protein
MSFVTIYLFKGGAVGRRLVRPLRLEPVVSRLRRALHRQGAARRRRRVILLRCGLGSDGAAPAVPGGRRAGMGRGSQRGGQSPGGHRSV